MKGGSAGMGMSKHRKSGHTGKSPAMRHVMKLEAERNIRKDQKGIRDPKPSVKELFK